MHTFSYEYRSFCFFGLFFLVNGANQIKDFWDMLNANDYEMRVFQSYFLLSLLTSTTEYVCRYYIFTLLTKVHFSVCVCFGMCIRYEDWVLYIIYYVHYQRLYTYSEGQIHPASTGPGPVIAAASFTSILWPY